VSLLNYCHVPPDGDCIAELIQVFTTDNSIQLLAKMDATIKQDLPPPGGYEKIQYARNPAKTFFRGMSRLHFRRIVLISLPSMFVVFYVKIVQALHLSLLITIFLQCIYRRKVACWIYNSQWLHHLLLL
jgi:hypothetical protein